MVKRSKVIIQQLKTIQKNPHIADRKWAIIEHPKISHKLFKTTRQVEKISPVCAGKYSNSPLCGETKTFLDKQNEKKKQTNKQTKKKDLTQVLIMFKSWVLLILNYNLKTMNLQLKMS